MDSSNNPVKEQTEGNQVVTHPPPPPPYTDINTADVPNLHQPQPIIFMTVRPNIDHRMVQQTAYISDYRSWSIFNILFCCFILGILACLKSQETERRKRLGDLQGALNSSKSAKSFNICATVIGIGIFTTFGILRATNVIQDQSSSYY